MRIIIVSVLICLFFISCSNDISTVDETIMFIPRNQSLVEAQQLVIGHWQWVRTISSGTTKWDDGLRTHIEFTAGQLVHFYQYDTVSSSASYSIILSAEDVVLGIGNYIPCPFRVNSQYLITDYRRDGGPIDLYERRM